jgi:hypothetical protein
MSEQATVHEEVQPAEAVAHGGEDVADTIDSPASTSTPSVIAEARRYRKRAQAAEKSLEELKTNLAEREKTIDQQRRTIESQHRRRMVDQALIEADSIDLETTRVLIEASISEIDQPKESDVAHAVQEVRRRKPFLFRNGMRRGKLGVGALSPNGVEATQEATSLERAAAHAVSTGKRTDLLRYLRLRRKN